MNTLEISKDKRLNQALVQCLRFFAQRGRMIRAQESTINTKTIKASSQAANKEVGNQEQH